MNAPLQPGCLATAQRLLQARQENRPIEDWPEALRPVSFDQAYRVQAAQMETLGPVGGWKVGAANSVAPPTCAPLPQRFRYASPDTPAGEDLSLRGIEVEIGLILGQDLPPAQAPYSMQQIWQAVSQVCVAVEIVESRFAQRDTVGRLSTLADLASHGALVHQAQGIAAQDMTRLQPEWARLQVGQQALLQGPNQNPAGELTRLLIWLANQGSHHLGGLQKGHVIITGTCLPMLYAAPGDRIQAAIQGIGELEFVCA
ncbi:fumarylacetoacetate hydrolase family protein [Alcaligenes parafaecalis]|uniref:Fumarylacetoacetate hydrolase family protein n=1 Tax=Alcaligenes parafaecalis TaxID=171260 RepID=A0ABT3VT84_9BURK|nr:fumarylacetoacetate hydrolase family protein [Alcaligenes parafaecalis]MCX5465386.1 fumarylacetoacetate hydrolase family protein [Alcaligenes parafaecalis]